ncbi:MAG: hypothetical protein D3909_17385 [Candidatus Electrothrix sp. ATG1]|nr:hypothetical protein [Candidatus Electrothrix sp. ATG1]
MRLFQVIIAALLVCWWPLSASSGNDDPFPPTGLDRIEDKMGALVVSVQEISKNVALGQQKIDIISDSFKDERLKTDKLREKSVDIEKRVMVVEISSNANTTEILSMKAKFFSLISALAAAAITAIGSYLKSRATERNTEQAKRIADAQEKFKHN